MLLRLLKLLWHLLLEAFDRTVGAAACARLRPGCVKPKGGGRMLPSGLLPCARPANLALDCEAALRLLPLLSFFAQP